MQSAVKDSYAVMPNYNKHQLLSLLAVSLTSLTLTQNVDALKSRRRREISSSSNIHSPNYNKSNNDLKSIDVEYYMDKVPVENGGKILRSGINVDVEDIYEPMRLTFITDPIDAIATASSDPIVALKRNFILNEVLPAAANQWSNALHVIPIKSFSFGDNFCGRNVPANTIDNKDMAIIIDAKDCGAEALAYAFICGVDTSTDRPTLGVVNFCLDTIELNADGNVSPIELKKINDVMLHEMGHVLGLYSEFLKRYRDPETGEPLTPRDSRGAPIPSVMAKCVNGKPDQELVLPSNNTLQYKEETIILPNNKEIQSGYYEIVLPTVRQVVRNQFACQSLTGARLENQPTNPTDCLGSHFDERLFFSDLMSAFYDVNGDYFSPLILALLQDSGFYKVNWDYARNSPFGLGAGCDFVEKKCIVNGAPTSAAKGFFCNKLFTQNRLMCGPSLRDKGRCDLFRGTSAVPVPYFANPNIGPSFEYADHCPVIDDFINSPKISCDDETATKQYQSEEFGADSKCINFINNNGISSGICLKTECNESEGNYVFVFKNVRYTCEQDFQEIEFRPSNTVTIILECPRLAAMCPDIFCPAMCSGKGICDWELPKPICKCFDPNDLSINCSGKSAVLNKEPTLSPETEQTRTRNPTQTWRPSVSSDPTESPSTSFSFMPSTEPTAVSTLKPSTEPSTDPTTEPSIDPTTEPSTDSTTKPSTEPSTEPSPFPSEPPSLSQVPSKTPSLLPSGTPSTSQIPTKYPSAPPSGHPTYSWSPTQSPNPTSYPSVEPTARPSLEPSSQPTVTPSSNPSFKPSNGEIIISPNIISLLMSTIFLLFTFT